jgi:hypothetical protein
MLVTKGRVNSHALGRHQGHNQKGQKPGDEEEENPGRMPGKSLFLNRAASAPHFMQTGGSNPSTAS